MAYEQVIETIRQKCASEHWYGADSQGPQWLQVAADDPRRSRFAFPPATEAQLQATEVALGFPLPPLLRMLYAQVANGGFGPHYGLRGAVGGFAGNGTLLEQYQWYRAETQVIDLAEYQGQWQQVAGTQFLVLPYEVWPDRFLSLCEYGCGADIWLDDMTGCVYRVGVMQEGHAITYQAASLEDWLHQWLSSHVTV